jgi:tetratricopeptide (TPR) repeat protein
MQQDRDYLVKQTFPRLRKLCNSRGVSWSEVDLRWGIPDEDKDEVLPFCLEEIQRCRPYFIGLLGERYGYIPTQLDPGLVKRFPWLTDHSGKSITEIEMLHGVLNDPAMAVRAYFYFRDPGYCDNPPAGQDPADFQCESADARSLLGDLKDAIRAASRASDPARACHIREPYRDPEHLGDLILADFTAIIDELFPPDSIPDSLDREGARHESFARNRGCHVVSRQQYIDRLEAHVRGQDPPLIVSGEPGIGKSAILAEWFLNHGKSRPDELTLIHFIGSTPESTDFHNLLRRILLELKRRSKLHGEAPADSETLRREFPILLAQAATGQRIVLLLDGLDQLDDRDAAPELGWLPDVFPASCRVIVSTSPGRCLDAARRRGWPELAVQPLTAAERRNLATTFLSRYSRRLNAARMERIVTAKQTVSPLFLCTVLDELRQSGEHERLDECLDYYLSAADAEALYRKVLARWERDYGRALVRESLCLLLAARRGLSDAEMLELLGRDGLPLPHVSWTPFYLAAESNFVLHSGLSAISNAYLKRAVRETYCPENAEQRRIHGRLADYFGGRLLQGKREVEEIPWQLAAAGEWRKLSGLLADMGFLYVTYVESGPEDVLRYWAQIESVGAAGMEAAYQLVIAAPDQWEQAAVAIVAQLLTFAHGPAAAGLWAFLVRHYRQTGEGTKLSVALWTQAMLVQKQGDGVAALALIDEHESICRQQGDESGLAASLLLRARILRDQGQMDAAWTLLVEQERLCRKIGHQYLLAAGLGNQGYIRLQQGDLDRALALHKEQEELSRRLGEKGELNAALGSLAIVYQARGELDQALTLYKEEEAVSREIGLQEGLAAALGGQGMVLRELGDWDTARALHTEEERLFRAIGSQRGIATSLGNRGILSAHCCEFDEALELLKEAERISRAIGDAQTLEAVLQDQERVARRQAIPTAKHVGALEAGATVLLVQGKPGEALSVYRAMERLCRRTGNNVGLSHSLDRQAYALDLLGRPLETLPILEERERLCREAGDISGLCHCLGLRASILQNNHQPEKALTLHQEEERLCRKVADKSGLSRSLMGQAFIVQGFGRPEAALALFKEAGELCRETGDQKMLFRLLGNQRKILDALGRTAESRGLQKQRDEISGTLENPAAQAGEMNDAVEAAEKSAQILQQLTSEGPSDTGVPNELTPREDAPGSLLEGLGDLQGGSDSYRHGIHILEKLLERDPENPSYHKNLTAAEVQMGDSLAATGNADEALRVFADTVERLTRYVRQRPEQRELRRDLSATHSRMGGILVGTGDRHRALAEFQVSVDILDRLISEEHDVPEWQTDLAISAYNLGLLHKKLGDQEQAGIQFQRCREALKTATEYGVRLSAELSAMLKRLEAQAQHSAAMERSLASEVFIAAMSCSLAFEDHCENRLREPVLFSDEQRAGLVAELAYLLLHVAERRVRERNGAESAARLICNVTGREMLALIENWRGHGGVATSGDGRKKLVRIDFDLATCLDRSREYFKLEFKLSRDPSRLPGTLLWAFAHRVSENLAFPTHVPVMTGAMSAATQAIGEIDLETFLKNL